MRVHHLILGVRDLAQTEVFYREILGLRLVDAFLDSTTGNEGLVMAYHNDRGEEGLQLLFVPYEPDRLPSPQHLAIEVNALEFQQILQAARRFKLLVRSHSPLDSKETGTARYEYRGQVYEHYYLLDPDGVN